MNLGRPSSFLRSSTLLAGALLTLVAALGCSGRGRSRVGERPEGPRVAVVDLRAGAPEVVESGGLFPLPPSQTFVGLVRTLARLENDPGVAAVFVSLQGPSLGFARSAEVGETLARLRAKKKPVVCHAHEIDNARAWLALVGCDEIWLSAAGDVATVGIAAEITYLKGALDRVGIAPDMLALGRFKSGPEALTRESPSEASAENLTYTLRDLRKEWLNAAAPERADVRAALEDGPYTPERAKALGLVTHVGYEEEALESAKARGHASRTETVFGPSLPGAKNQGLFEVVRSLTGATPGSKPKIAVVPMAGGINVSAGGPLSDGGITSDAFVRTLKRLRQDDTVKAVVLRLDSPGGSPLASDLLWKQLMLLRKEKPVVVSIGSMAASGGYYIASAATKIVASKSAIVGSIGVFGGKIVLAPALEKLGIKSYAFPASPEPGAAARALHLSPFSPWDDATRERVRESMQRIYDLFLERVAEGRGMAVEDVAKTAEGEIFLATVGKERGLVDEIGGVERALELARSLAKLGPDAPVTIEGARESLLEMLLLGEEADEAAIEGALGRYAERRASFLGLPLQSLERELRPHAAVVGPLLAGENVVLAAPFVVDLR